VDAFDLSCLLSIVYYKVGMAQKGWLYLSIFLWMVLGLEATKPPLLTPQDAKNKVEEILKAHVSHQLLTPDIFKRALQNYIDELDPAKTYFLSTELEEWLNPSEAFLEQVADSYSQGTFAPFKEMHRVMVSAIERRGVLEEQVLLLPLNDKVQAADLKEMSWASSVDELKTRLHDIRSLQLKVSDKLDAEENRVQFLQKMQKKRLAKESDMIGSSPKEQEQIVLSFVLKAMSSALDSQTVYFTPLEANQFMIQVQQRLFGIGAQLRDDLDGFTVVKIVEGSPAARSNQVKMGDKIIAVDNEPVMGLDIIDAVALVRGPQGSQVDLTILREGKEEKLVVTLVRDEIVLQDSRFEVSYEPCGDGIIALLNLHSFYQDNNTSSADDLRGAIEKLKKEYSIKGVILDLRNNGGGLLPQAVAVSGLFLSKGVIVSIKDNTGQVQHLRNLEDRRVWDGPLIALTSRTSASAAEIVAQTLQDYGRAIVVGDAETFGKGTFQTFTLEASQFGNVNPKGEYKVTRGRYYTVSGRSPQLVGVKADIVVPGPFARLEVGEKFSKFPVETDQISAHFEDNLEDVPALHRAYFEKVYRSNKQSVLTVYQPYLDRLKRNSEERLSKNKYYQELLEESVKEGPEMFDAFSKTDLQLIEAKNIMKDLLLLSIEGKEKISLSKL
jgi:carboxyl-terminal processing protease